MATHRYLSGASEGRRIGFRSVSASLLLLILTLGVLAATAPPDGGGGASGGGSGGSTGGGDTGGGDTGGGPGDPGGGDPGGGKPPSGDPPPGGDDPPPDGDDPPGGDPPGGGDPANPPTAVITANYGLDGMAPFTVHVHGLESVLQAGSDRTARYEWDFGDSGSSRNQLAGWNAAHTYDDPGSYIITLRVIDEIGAVDEAEVTVSVAPDARTRLYVSPSGNDSNSGLSTSAPIRTISKASSLLTDDMAVLFRRGGTYSTTVWLNVTNTNVLVGAYDSGVPPRLRWTSTDPYAHIITIRPESERVVIQDLELTSSFTTSTAIARGVRVMGTNITVRRCTFGSLSYAMNSAGDAYGWLTQDNTAGVLGAYYVWGEGEDHVHIDNTVGGSVSEHNIRMGGVTRALIAHNDLTNEFKTGIWCMLGSDAYIAHNTLHFGRIRTGPNFAFSESGQRFRRIVVEGNTLLNAGVEVLGGTEFLTVRSNLIDDDAGAIISIEGYQPQWNRTVSDVDIFNNTGLNRSTLYGKFLRIGEGTLRIRAANNLYWSPQLNTGWAGANVLSEENDLHTHSFWNNLWAQPDAGWAHHFLALEGVTAPEWATMSQTANERYRTFAAGDLDAAGAPTFDATLGIAARGVQVDLNGKRRPFAGAVTVGAIEMTDGTGNLPGDLNSDGIVNALDMYILLAAFGTNDPLADLNQDGTVNTLDLLLLLSYWT